MNQTNHKHHYLLVIFYLLLVGFLGYTAFTVYQYYQKTETDKNKSEQALIVESRKKASTLDTNEDKVVYLSPTGAKAKKDLNADIIDQIVRKTFSYNSPEDFLRKAKFVKNRVEGPFYSYWFGDGIKPSYETLKLQQNGSTLKRRYENYYLTKKGENHYFAVLSTYTKLGYDDHSTPNIKSFGLDIRWNAKTGRWNFKQLPNVNLQ